MAKYIIDTDIGDDIDDALAISTAFGLNVDVIGITTAFKNTQLRARQANKLLALLGREDVPVYAGYGDSVNMKNDNQQMICQYTSDLEKECYEPLNAKEGSEGEAAIDFMIEMAETYGEELIIIGLAPLMNIAKAIQKAPDSMKKVGRIVLMAGAFYEQFVEWNILCDPEAAKIVLDFDVPVYCVGTDVTLPCMVTEEEYQKMIAGGDELRDYLAVLVRKWVDCSGRIPILHDPLAVYVAVTGQHVEFEKRMIGVELEGKYSRGLTLDLDNINRHEPKLPEGRRIYVGKTVDEVAFKNEFFKIVFEAK